MSVSAQLLWYCPWCGKKNASENNQCVLCSTPRGAALPAANTPGAERHSRDTAQASVKPTKSDLRLALNAAGILLFPIAWPFFLYGLARGDPNTRRIGALIPVVLAMFVVLIAVIAVVQAVTR